MDDGIGEQLGNGRMHILADDKRGRRADQADIIGRNVRVELTGPSMMTRALRAGIRSA